jgi:hypothetical protein
LFGQTLGRRHGPNQYESELITSPLARVPSCHHAFIEIELLTNWTWPSAIITLHPPGWLLVAGVMFPWSADSTSQPRQPLRHEAHGNCVEFGGTMVLNIVIDSAPHDHSQPRLVLRLLPAAEAVAKFVLQPCSHAAMTGPGAVVEGAIVCHTSMKPDGPFSLTPVVKFWRVVPLARIIQT